MKVLELGAFSRRLFSVPSIRGHEFHASDGRMGSPSSQRNATVKSDSLGIPFLSSVAIHICAILIGSVVLQGENLRRQDFFPVRLIDLPRAEAPPPRKVERPAEIKTTTLPKKVESTKDSPLVGKPAVTQREPATSVPHAAIKEQPAESLEAKPPTPGKTDTPSSFALGSRMDDGGSQAGPGHPFGQAEAEVESGSETAPRPGGTAVSGLGRGSGAPGLPAQGVVGTNREAKPIQTARAAYPPMALRMGLESDVTLRIEVDPEGKVTTAEIIKSGGAGFDEEALKAVKQSRFEPAQKDDRKVPAEFTYIYRFRLQNRK